jgi:hypothetical protein
VEDAKVYDLMCYLRLPNMLEFDESMESMRFAVKETPFTFRSRKSFLDTIVVMRSADWAQMLREMSIMSEEGSAPSSYTDPGKGDDEDWLLTRGKNGMKHHLYRRKMTDASSDRDDIYTTPSWGVPWTKEMLQSAPMRNFFGTVIGTGSSVHHVEFCRKGERICL